MTVFDKQLAHFLAWIVRLTCGARSRWINCEPSTRQRIYFANHGSHLDFIMLWSALPEDIRQITRPVAARDYWDTSRFRRYLARTVFNSIMIDRPGHGKAKNPLKVVEDALSGIGQTHSLIIFPEGTRGHDEEPAAFKGGIHALAVRRPDIELVPVYLENLNRILPKGEFFLIPLLSSITFGPPLHLDKNETKRDFLVRMRQAIIDLKES